MDNTHLETMLVYLCGLQTLQEYSQSASHTQRRTVSIATEKTLQSQNTLCKVCSYCNVFKC